MQELKSIEEGEDKPLSNSPFLEPEKKESFLKRHKLYFIIGAAILVIVLTVVLCVCLIKPTNKDKDKEDDKGQPTEKLVESIKLEVNSDEDDKEISFLSEDFKIAQTNLRNLAENYILYVDGTKYSFAKSMKLKKGKHSIELLLNETTLTCENMFKNCKDILSVHFNVTYDCHDSLANMFNGCTSLSSVNFEKIKTSEAKSMDNMFDKCKSLENIAYLEKLETKKVTSMNEMFSNCESLKTINLANFKVKLVSISP